jgi:hypothetical protein
MLEISCHIYFYESIDPSHNMMLQKLDSKNVAEHISGRASYAIERAEYHKQVLKNT